MNRNGTLLHFSACAPSAVKHAYFSASDSEAIFDVLSLQFGSVTDNRTEPWQPAATVRFGSVNRKPNRNHV